jgi:hypothetical protein
MTDEKSFADEPRTLGEARAEKTANALDWSPRDLLIHTLRAIDRGELKPENLVLCMSETIDGIDRSTWFQAGNHLKNIGNIFKTAMRICTS